MEWKQIRAVIFDLDGTLYEYRWLKLHMILGNIRGLRHLARLEKGRDAVRHASFPDQRSLVAAASRISHPGNPEAFQDWYENRFYASFVSLLKPHMLRPGTEALLRKLQERNVKVAVCSDYGCVAERLQSLGLDLELFDHLASAEECGHLKPQLPSYRKILEDFDLDPSEVLIVGDRAETDGVAARQLGCRFHAIENSDDWSRLVKILESSR